MSNAITAKPLVNVRFGEVREILISPGFGAGWTTWAWPATEAERREMLYDADIIAHLKAGGNMTDEAGLALLQKYEERDICILGARDLCVMTVTTPFRVTEYDGAERVEEFNAEGWEF